MSLLLCIGIYPNIANAVGTSWERSIDNVSSTDYLVSAYYEGHGNLYVKCYTDSEFIKNPYKKIIQANTQCKTKMTTGAGYNNSTLTLEQRVNPNNYPPKSFVVSGNAILPTNEYIRILARNSIGGSAEKIEDAGGAWFNVQNTDKPSSSYNGGPLPVKGGNGYVVLVSDAPITQGLSGHGNYGVTQPTTRNSTIYNFVSEPITLDLGSVSGGKFTLIHGTPEIEAGDISVKPESSNVTQFVGAEYKDFTIPMAIHDTTPGKNSWIPGVVSMEHSYHPENYNTLRGTYWFHDATTNKVIDRHITNFSIDTDQGGKFDFPVKTHDGKIQMVRVLLNTSPFGDTVAQDDGSMVICPVGFKEIVGCE
ncbi:hypothetical protein CUN60_06105 [Aquella oligotrophica]|uniref:Uncharacterized protein n=2 Tax=Aquella oligotrophica TaxID=2067065 RepID=A0A2I7N5Z8_9NEIS|nr:hypothetical protein CUN60_06105 [Aquella oligotrophica]